MKCLEKEVMALCRYTTRRNTPPRFVALVPQEEEVDEQKVQIAPPGMGGDAAFPSTIGCHQHNSFFFLCNSVLGAAPLKAGDSAFQHPFSSVFSL